MSTLTERDWWRITLAAKPRTAVLDIYDEIGPWGVTAKDLVTRLRALDVDEIQLHLNSPGGSALDAIAILNSLRDHPARVVATIDGIAASAASVIAMAGDEVVMARNSELMIHDAAGFAMGDADTMRDLADRLDKVSDNIASVYADRAGGDVAAWRDVMRAETWYSAQEAVDAGLADRLVVPKPAPPGDGPKNRWDYSIFNYAGRAAAPPPPVPGVHARVTDTLPAGQGHTEREGAVADYAKLREAFGLGPDSSDDEVRAAMRGEAPVESIPAVASTAPSGDAPAADAGDAGTPDTNATIVVSTSVWEDTQKTIKDLSDFVAKTKRDERDGVLAKAVEAGKFRPTQLADFANLWDKDPEGTRRLVDKMTPNSALAVAALGYATDLDEDSVDAEFVHLFPKGA